MRVWVMGCNTELKGRCVKVYVLFESYTKVEVE